MGVLGDALSVLAFYMASLDQSWRIQTALFDQSWCFLMCICAIGSFTYTYCISLDAFHRGASLDVLGDVLSILSTLPSALRSRIYFVPVKEQSWINLGALYVDHCPSISHGASWFILGAFIVVQSLSFLVMPCQHLPSTLQPGTDLGALKEHS